VAHLRGQYQTALQRREHVARRAQQAKKEANRLNENAIDYTLLKRDVDSNRQLYEGLLENSRGRSDRRLRSNSSGSWMLPVPPNAPVEPNVPATSFAFILGITSGIGLAFC